MPAYMYIKCIHNSLIEKKINIDFKFKKINYVWHKNCVLIITLEVKIRVATYMYVHSYMQRWIWLFVKKKL